MKIIVGVSGGVDSSVAAYLLKQQGHDVQGVFMKNWQEDDEHCPATQDLADARAVCAKLSIPLHTINFSDAYWDRVFQYFLDEYAAGRTPNPDIMCNKEIKFKAFLDYAVNELDADFIATGHYARRQSNDGAHYLLKGKDSGKDQSYFLHQLDQAQLAQSLFPIGEYDKTDIRQIAKEQNFITHDKKDSTGICFIGERKFKTFLQQYLLAQPGDIETPEGKVIGQHDGLMYYTMGQRQGLKIGGLKDADEAPWYVAEKDIKRNVLIVVQGTEHPLLFKSTLQCSDIHWINSTLPTCPFSCTAKIRYRQADQACTVTQQLNGVYQIQFEHPQRAITPGQSLVLYNGERCLGGGVIG